MVLFLIASGLSLIFGVTRIVNFAHGSFYMLAAYLTYTLAATLPLGAAAFYVAVPLAAASVGLAGLGVEVALLRRVYRAPELYQLLLTFALVLVVADVVKLFWGSENLTGPAAPGLAGSVEIAGQLFPTYDLALIGLGPLVAAGLWWLFYRTRWGVLIRAATQDREMVAVLGVDQARLFTSVFVLGSFLAGLGGALQVPRQALTNVMDASIITEAFVVVVVGGMGSVPGALLAAALIGVIDAFGVLVLPRASLLALLVTWTKAPMLLAFAAAPLAAAVGAALYGYFCVRLSSIYFAMLTLAFAQIAFAIVHQWYDVTGGDNGLLGIWPAAWLAGPLAYYYLALAACGGWIALLARIGRAPFGLTLRAARDHARRAETVGINIRLHQWTAFVVAGFFGGVAGGTFAFLKGSVFPNLLAVPMSVEPLVMVLLGGVQAPAGAPVGAAIYKLLDTVATRYTEYWQLVLGAILILLVLAFPRGILGVVGDRRA